MTNQPKNDKNQSNKSTDGTVETAEKGNVNTETVNPTSDDSATTTQTKEVKPTSDSINKPSLITMSQLQNLKWERYLLVVALIMLFVQFRQIDNLQKDSLWLASKIKLVESKDLDNQKFAIMNFDDTVREWKKLDPSGKAITEIMDSTIMAYNKKGYTIIDSKSIIGGAANTLFINVLPSQYENGEKQ